jgi:hypothetical protein
MMSYAYPGPIPAKFFGEGAALDLADFAGTGSVVIGVLDGSGYDNNTLSGTVTETIVASVIEPSTWSLLLMGAALAGAALRRRRADAGALPQ